MKLKTKKILLVIYGILLIASFILTGVFEDDKPLGIIFLISFLFLFCIGATVLAIALKIGIKRDNQLFRSFVEQKDFHEIKRIFEEKCKNYLIFALKVNARYYVVVALFALNDLDSAKIHLRSDFGALRLYAQYFETLLILKDGNVDHARLNSAELMRSEKKGVILFQKMLSRIFAAIDTKNKEDKFYHDSMYPILKDIYEKAIEI